MFRCYVCVVFERDAYSTFSQESGTLHPSVIYLPPANEIVGR